MRTVAARLSKLEVVWRRPQAPRLEVVPFEDADGRACVRVRSGTRAGWKAIARAAWEAV
jgi:hypothetical protein